MALVQKARGPRAATARWWPCAPEPGVTPLAEGDVVIGFYEVTIDGAKERRQAAPLRKLGLHAAGAAARPRAPAARP